MQIMHLLVISVKEELFDDLKVTFVARSLNTSKNFFVRLPF